LGDVDSDGANENCSSGTWIGGPPAWQNQGTNDTDNAILQAQAINLTAQGISEIGLNWTLLATNESGIWQNKTVYGSPMGMNNAVGAWKWSNFTWSNSSIAQGTIAWRIYYNDSSGNQNVTSIQTFTVSSVLLWYNNQSSISVSGCSKSFFNITWVSGIGVSSVFYEGNWSGSPLNYTMTQIATNVYHYNYTLPNGIFYWKSYANDTNNIWQASDKWNFTVSGGGYLYNLRGYAYDYSTGYSLSSATATLIVRETGDRNTGSVTNGFYNLSLGTCLNSNQTKFTVGLIFSNGVKKGFSQIVLGNGPFTTQTQQCSIQRLHFSGVAVDANSGIPVSSGTISVSVKDINTYTNSTTFSNGNWDIYIWPCLVSGGMYQFNFIIASSDGRQSNLLLNQILP
jgi:hypothetical protein